MVSSRVTLIAHLRLQSVGPAHTAWHVDVCVGRDLGRGQRQLRERAEVERMTGSQGG